MELAKRSVRRAKGTGRYLPGLGLSCLLVLASFSGCYLEPGTGATTQPARTPVLGATSTSQPGEVRSYCRDGVRIDDNGRGVSR